MVGLDLFRHSSEAQLQSWSPYNSGMCNNFREAEESQSSQSTYDVRNTMFHTKITVLHKVENAVFWYGATPVKPRSFAAGSSDTHADRTLDLN